MGQSPSEANTHSASSEIPRMLWDPTAHYLVHMGPPLVVGQGKSPHFPKIHLRIILPSTSRSTEWPLPFTLPNQTSPCISHTTLAWYTTCQSHTSWIYHRNTIWWTVHITELIMLTSRASRRFLLRPNTPLSTLISNTMNQCSSSFINMHNKR